MHEQATPEKILQTGLAFWASKTLLSAIEIGVFSELSRGPEHFDSISGRLGSHDRDLPTKKMLIKKAFDAIPTGGALIVYEAIIDDDRSKNVFGLMMSLNMLIETPGGFDYTGADCVGWMKEAGFSATRVEHLVGPDSMVVGTK